MPRSQYALPIPQVGQPTPPLPQAGPTGPTPPMPEDIYRGPGVSPLDETGGLPPPGMAGPGVDRGLQGLSPDQLRQLLTMMQVQGK